MPPGQKRRRVASGTKIRSQSRDGLSFRVSEFRDLPQLINPSVFRRFKKHDAQNSLPSLIELAANFDLLRS
jgi:hypothetical protein